MLLQKPALPLTQTLVFRFRHRCIKTVMAGLDPAIQHSWQMLG
jgi:hypothetical protein